MQLNFKSYGHGPALIILHGLFGSLDNWTSHARRLAEHFSVFTIDQRNHGKSPHHDDWDYPIMAEDLHEFMDQHRIYTASIIGHSMGGKTAMQLAADYPERIEKLVVADMAPKAYEPHHTQLLATLNRLDLSRIESRQQAELHLRDDIPDPVVRQFLLKSLRRAGNGGFEWKFNLPVISKKYDLVLKGVELHYPFEKPTLFVYGENSSYVQPGDKDQIQEYFPRAIFKEIPDTGHWIHAEAPEQFLEIVSSFL